MLKKLGFQNSYCFKDPVVLDMSVKMITNTKTGERYPEAPELGKGVRYLGGNRGILPVAAIYGKNASGKTKLLQTLRDVVRDALGDSFVLSTGLLPSSPYQQIIDNRRFGMTDNPNEVIEYSICVVMKDFVNSDGTRTQNGAEYSLYYTIGPNGVEKEIMKRRGLGNNDKEETLYSRDSKCKAGTDKTINAYVSLLRDRRENRLWFSQIAPAQNSGLSPLYEWFRFVRDGMTFNEIDGKHQSSVFKDVAKRIAEDNDKDFRNKLLWLLQGLDSSIYTIDGIPVNPDKDSYSLYIYHNVENSETVRAHNIQDESSGTKQLIVQFPLIYRSFKDGLPFICDELDKMMHPIVFKRVVDWFGSPNVPRDDTAQLIFTAHDTIALDSDCLRKDEVHIVEKSEGSVSSIRRLSDIVADPYPNMEDEFRRGIYGSTPSSFPYDYRMAGDAGAKE